MRVADRNPHAVAAEAGYPGLPGAEHRRGAHVHGDLAVGLHADQADPGARLDRELRAVRQAVLDEVAREHPGAVAAHLGYAAVGVAVVHEPLGGQAGRLPDGGARGGDGSRGGQRGRGGRRQHVVQRLRGAECAGSALGQRGGQHLHLDNAEYPVRADPGAAVTQAAHQSGRKVKLSVGVGQDHEVVLRAVSLREVHALDAIRRSPRGPRP